MLYMYGWFSELRPKYADLLDKQLYNYTNANNQYCCNIPVQLCAVIVVVKIVAYSILRIYATCYR